MSQNKPTDSETVAYVNPGLAQPVQHSAHCGRKDWARFRISLTNSSLKHDLITRSDSSKGRKTSVFSTHFLLAYTVRLKVWLGFSQTPLAVELQAVVNLTKSDEIGPAVQLVGL